MVISLRGFMTQLLPLYPELMVITTGLAVLMLDFLVGRKYKALLGWFSLARSWRGGGGGGRVTGRSVQ